MNEGEKTYPEDTFVTIKNGVIIKLSGTVLDSGFNALQTYHFGA